MTDSIREPFVILDAILAFIVLVSGIGILNTLMIQVAERTGEIAVMRAVVSTRRQIYRMIVAEGSFIGLIGSVTGIVLGAAITYAAMLFQEEIGGFPVRFTVYWEISAFALLFRVLVGCLSGLLPRHGQQPFS